MYKTLLAEFAGCHDKAESRAAETLDTKEATFQPNPKSHSVAEPILPRTDEPIFTPISTVLAQDV